MSHDQDKQAHDQHGHGGGGHHHILDDKVVYKVGAALFVLTAITVAMSKVNLGPINMAMVLLVASVKATLVAAFFMALKYDKRENTLIFVSSFVFLAIFIVLTGTDVFFRPSNFRVDSKTPDRFALAIAAGGGVAKFKNPWNSVTPELLAHGKTLFEQQCVSCHGANGMGDGLAAASLNPKPRNFHSIGSDWKNGHKPSQIYKTLKEGIAGGSMASFASLPSEDRWALSHYVAQLNPEKSTDSAEDFKKIGYDPEKGAGDAAAAASIPIDIAIDRLAEPSTK
jgi:caa(3)-type oxidase subunit IV